jgi:hypothetical protein
MSQIAPGVTFVSTPGHGYVKLSPELQRNMPKCLRLPSYEEDVEWSRVYVAFPHLFAERQVELAHEILKNYHPDEYAEFSGEPVDPAESRVLRERQFRDAHSNDYLAVSAQGDWHDKVPAGMVGMWAIRGGRLENGQYASDDRAYFLVPEDRYHERGEFGYVIQADDKPWIDHT